ncbi:MAG: hypothetical protein Ct9H90mP30_3760 [Actinomycetota bacterium]|nr:MAG: hypothetical protein Ct9H90mP30_3760 [Actinomycetota bacterium]
MSDSEELWDKRYSDNPLLNPPSEFLEVFEQYLPTHGTCVDIAGGNGRNALWFAKKGYSTSVIDISSVALNQATKSAQSQNVELECIHWDIEKNLLPPERKWDIALLTLFLNRGILQTANEYLTPQGILLFAQPTKKNLERHQHPSERFLLDSSEIFKISESLSSMEILHVDEGWRESRDTKLGLFVRK